MFQKLAASIDNINRRPSGIVCRLTRLTAAGLETRPAPSMLKSLDTPTQIRDAAIANGGAQLPPLGDDHCYTAQCLFHQPHRSSQESPALSLSRARVVVLSDRRGAYISLVWWWCVWGAGAHGEVASRNRHRELSSVDRRWTGGTRAGRVRRHKSLGRRPVTTANQKTQSRRRC